ncbi:hypothetical protein Tco_0862765 [Tanacetum coccineum]
MAFNPCGGNMKSLTINYSVQELHRYESRNSHLENWAHNFHLSLSNSRIILNELLLSFVSRVDENIIVEHYLKFFQSVASWSYIDLKFYWRMGGRPGMTNYRYWLLIASSSWSFVSVVPSQMTHLVGSITLDSARSSVMQNKSSTKWEASSIPIVLSWSGSISSDSFLPSILLWLMIIVAIVGVGVTVFVVIIVAVVVVVVESSFVV